LCWPWPWPLTCIGDSLINEQVNVAIGYFIDRTTNACQ
jgi:hypothetical protein